MHTLCSLQHKKWWYTTQQK